MSTSLNIAIEKGQKSKLKETDFHNLEFGATYSDHMFVVDYINNEWVKPRIIPFQNFSMSPAAAVLHYGQSIFEGLKAYHGNNNDILVYRPEAHQQRLNASAIRLCMPEVPKNLFMEGLTELLKIDREWI